MKTILTLICLTLASVGLASQTASAQGIAPGAAPPAIASGGQAAVTPFQSVVATTWPGRYWFGVNLADNGFGYSGSYASLGAKTRIFDDYFDGRWLAEIRGHVSLERGQFFGNLGIERVFSIDAAGADIVFGVWADHDNDRPGDFAHAMNQVGLNGGIRTQGVDFFANGYIPLGTNDYTQGDPTGRTVFFQNNIVLQPGIDSALEGWDANFRVRPEVARMVNGSVDLGVYQYKSSVVEDFVGFRTRFGFQALQGMIVNLDMNYDDRFDFTAGLQLAWMLGGVGPNAEYAGLGRDLESANRPDHITRYQQDLVLAIDPDTGSPYVVWHVDNSVAATGDGSFESRFATLAEAEAVSGFHNIIFVHNGDGTTTGMDSGIVLKDGQLLLGDGIAHLLPVQGGMSFSVFNDLDGMRPTITNTAGSGVTLADRNTVRGLIIDGSGGGLAHGIFGDGTGGTLSDGVIEDVDITGTPLLNGIHLNAISGDWTIARNRVETASFDGLFVDNVTDPTATFLLDSNSFVNNTRDGIHFEDWNGSTVLITGNDVSGNGQDGLSMARYGGTGVDMVIRSHTGSNNGRFGINLDTGTGDLMIIDSTISGNVDDGILISDWTNGAGETTVIDSNTITGNGVGTGAGIMFNLTTGTQRVTISNSTIDGNGIGIDSISDGVGTTLTLNVLNNLSISNNGADAVRIASRGGSTTTFTLQNSAASPLTMASNGGSGGFGISFFAEDGGGPVSVLNATVRNVAMTATGAGNAASGVFGSAQGDAQLNILVDNSSFDGGVGGNTIMFDFDSNAGVVSSVSVIDSSITNSGNDGVDINVGAGSQVDIVLQGLTITTGGGTGIDLNMSGTSMTRLLADNNTISGFTFDGLSAVTNNTSQFLATISGNTITGNGPGLDPTMDPYFDGINIVSNGTSRQSLIIANNNIMGNSELGLDINTVGASQIDVLLSGNTISGNDTGAASAGVNDFNATNGAAGTLCLAMSTNFFTLASSVTNNNAPATFVVELDGATNGPGVPNFVGGVGNFTTPAFGTTCQPNITAQQAVFAGAGFP